MAQRLHLESRLRKAVAQKEFVLHYQTKVDLASRQIRGLEALIRWHDPEFGLVSPLEFVPLLEESGQIVEVGRWVFEQAVADTNRWKSLGLEVPRVAVALASASVATTTGVTSAVAATNPMSA